MGYIKRNCDNCGKEYKADTRNLNRGWGLCCSKSCAASKREKSKPGYDPKKVAVNNLKREVWNEREEVYMKDSNHWGNYTGKRTSEGYKIYGTTAVDEFGDAVYDIGIGEYDEGDSEYWDNSDNGKDF